MAAPRKYPDELRERAIRLVLDAKTEPGSGGKNVCRRIGEQLGINPETLRGWVSQAEIDAGSRLGTSTDTAARLAELERENRELRVYTDLALDALNMGIWTRRHACDDLTQLIHRSDRGVQYVAIRCTERLSEVDVVASVGSVGNSCDNAMAEAFNSLFKAALVRNRGPWNGLNDLELAVAECIDWYNHRRLHGELGLIPSVEHEARHAAQNSTRQPAGA